MLQSNELGWVVRVGSSSVQLPRNLPAEAKVLGQLLPSVLCLRVCVCVCG